MELEEIESETKGKFEENQPKGETQQTKVLEEEETDIYSKLQGPSEDLYSDAPRLGGASRSKGTAGLQDVRLWKRVCACLTGVCLLLLLIVIFLVVKLQSGASTCQETQPNAAIQTRMPGSVQRYQDCGCHKCPAGWVYCGQSCFLLYKQRMSWDDGKKYCQDQKGQLAIVTDKTVQIFLTQKGKNLTYWIGLKEEQSWTWVDSTNLDKSYWSDVPGSGHCALLKSTKPNDKNWFKSYCERPSYFICEIKI